VDKAVLGGQNIDPNPTDRAKCESKHCVLTDGDAVCHADLAAKVPDVRQLLPLAVSIPPVRGKRGRRRRRSDQIVVDKAYDCQPARDLLHWQGIDTFIPKHRTQLHGPGYVRWAVERTLSWFQQFRRLRTRYDRNAEVQEAQVGGAMIYWNFLK
jgi:transposase